MKQNWGKQFDDAMTQLRLSGIRPRLLLHVCCAPCSSHCLEVLAECFEITAFFYNPNISPEEEHAFRLSEFERFLGEAGYPSIRIQTPEYDPKPFEELARGLEDVPEGGERCLRCYRLRLRRTAEEAKIGGFDAFTTTLSISPHKNADWLNEIGMEMSEMTGVPWLFSDFKKKNGYQRSIELSREFHLYRQDYCGCQYSKAARVRRQEGQSCLPND